MYLPKIIGLHNVSLTTTVTESVDEAVEVTTNKMGMLQEYLDEALPKLLSFGIKLVIAVVVLFVGIRIINAFRHHMQKNFKRSGMEPGVAQFIDSILKFVLYFLLIVLILTQFGLTTATVVAILGSSGLTLGLALQGSLSNFAGGVIILLQKPFVVGDYILEDTHKNEGTVDKITMIYTTMKTIDNKEVVIPNGTLANSSLINYTAQKKRRVDLLVGISYGSDIKKAKEILEQVAKDSPYLLKDEPIVAYVSELNDSSVDMGLRFWVGTDDYWTARWGALEEVKHRFDAKGIEIPFPQVTVSYAEEKPE